MNLQYPVDPTAPVTQTFQEHVQRAKAMNARYNGGIDWGVPTGTPVRAAAAGIVIRAGLDYSGYGNHVRIDHGGGYLTLYAHLYGMLVKPGRQVAAGEMIGYSDNTGNSTGPHLHFEVRCLGKPVDPAPLLVAQDSGTQPAPGPLLAVAVDSLNVRSGPGIQYPIVRTLVKDTTVTALALSGDTWVEIGQGEWAAMAYGQEIYLRPA